MGMGFNSSHALRGIYLECIDRVDAKLTVGPVPLTQAISAFGERIL